MSQAQKDDLGAAMLPLNSWTTSVPCPIQPRHPQDTGNLLHSSGFSFTTAERSGPGQCALKLNKQKLWIDPPDLSNSTQSLHTVFAQLLTTEDLKTTVLPLRRITIRSEDVGLLW